MHAPPHRRTRIRLGQSVALALLASLPLAFAGCGNGGSSHDPTLSAPRSPSVTVPAGDGPAISVAGNAPRLAGHPALDAVLRRDASAAGAGCAPRVERDDAQLASFVWKCPSGRLYAATVEVAAGRQVDLSDLLTGSYASYLSSTARAQFQADGRANPSVSDLGTWYLTPVALVVVFPAGSVSYPVTSLTPYLRAPSLFG